MEPLLRLQDIRHRYNGRLVLDIPELRIARGSITGLSGPNGSGKSTLLRILSLTEKCTAGTVMVAGEPARPLAGTTGIDLTLLPQEAYLLRRTVFENIAYGLRLRKRKAGLRAEVEQGLALVGLDPAFAKRRWHELSGGEAQRVALAARLVLRPACLLLDEPTASVDLESARSIRRAVLFARKQMNTALVIASHNRSWLDGLCDRVIYLYNGRILDGSFDNVLLGPWEKRSDTEYCTRLTDGQAVLARLPPHPGSSGVIAPESLVVAERNPAAGEKVLRGVVTALSLDRQKEKLRVHVLCGDHPFVAAVPDQSRMPAGCLPGREVALLYRPGDITWLP